MFRVFVQLPTVCDWIMMTCMSKRKLYEKHKVTHLTEPNLDSVSDRMLYKICKNYDFTYYAKDNVFLVFVRQVSMGTTYGTQ